MLDTKVNLRLCGVTFSATHFAKEYGGISMIKKAPCLVLAVLFLLLVGCTSASVEQPRGIESVAFGYSDGSCSVYTITYTDGSTSTFSVPNGADGADGQDGINGQDGADGKDGVNGKDGADGRDGVNGTNGIDGQDGHSPVITIQNGYWYIDSVDAGVPAQGQQGEAGNGIASIALTSSLDLIDTYTITFTNGQTATFTVTNGADAQVPDALARMELIEKGDGYVLASVKVGGTVAFGTFATHSKYLIPAYVTVTVTLKTGGSYGFARTDEDGVVIEAFSNANYSSYTFEARETATYLYVSDVKVESLEDHSILNQSASGYWEGKRIWWCGTSIPAGGYPLLVGEELGATVYQEAVGGSMCRANVSTGDYNGANISNITSSLSMTLEEAEAFLANYDTLKTLSKNTAWPEALSESQIKRVLSGSFETKLLPYLDGTKPMPDLFVIDHGHNDWKYRDANGNIDIELAPTVENIRNGLLAEDTYMTANNYENLKNYFGDLSGIPEDRLEEFAASVNRNCYKGAVNFILTLILTHNPQARIVFISNYEYENGYNPAYANVIDAQKALAEEWCFPIFEIYKYLGYSNKLIPGSKDYMTNTYPNYVFEEDVTVYEIYNVDKVHPSSDTTGRANEIYAGLIAAFLQTVR